MNLQKTGVFIQNARKRMNLSQRMLGEKLSVTSQAVSKWERGVTPINARFNHEVIYLNWLDRPKDHFCFSILYALKTLSTYALFVSRYRYLSSGKQAARRVLSLQYPERISVFVNRIF